MAGAGLIVSRPSIALIRQFLQFMTLRNSSKGVFLFLSLVWIAVGSAAIASAQVEWRPVIQAELDQKAPKVEPDADAEAIFWDVQLDDKERKRLYYNHYVRVKIYTERGRERFAKLDIVFSKDKTVEDVAARVIKPDGSIIVLTPGDIFERELVRAGKNVVRAKSFAVPGIEPGVIVEYQYREAYKGDTLDFEQLWFQRDIPIQKVTYRIRPHKDRTINFAFENMESINFLLDESGFYVGSLENVPALREEPYMPPEAEVRKWAMLRYDTFFGFRWSILGNYMNLAFEEITEPKDEIRRKAVELTAGVTSDEDRLRRIYDFCQKNIRNVSVDRSLTDEQKEKIKNKKASDTLKRGMGFARDIDYLFASLARAAGFNVNVMMSGNREVRFFNHQTDQNPGYVHHSGIAVRFDSTWRPFNPGSPIMPFGMTFPHDELVSTMIAGMGGHSWIRIPTVDAAKSVSRRTGKFKLLDDGTLEGFVRVSHQGHQATTRRIDLYEKTAAEREDFITKTWRESLGSAEVTALSVESFADSTQPYTYSFNVKVASYAQKTGKRMFMQPGFFKYRSNPVFSSETRKYNIYFEYPWSEEDEIEIELPAGYEPEGLATPGNVNEANGIGSLTIDVTYDRQKRTLVYRRKFMFGGGGRVIFPVTAYKPLKFLFDSFHKSDSHPLSLRQMQ